MSFTFALGDSTSVLPVIVFVVGLVLVIMILLANWAKNYKKVGPNQVMVVSGRRYHLANGEVRNFRLVKGGGTFLLPILERMDVLSLEVLTMELQAAGLRTSKGEQVDVDYIAQVRIKGDDAALCLAAQHFVNKDVAAIKNTVGPLLEKHLRASVGESSFAEMDRNLRNCEARVEAGVSQDLGSMGLGLLTFSIRQVKSQSVPG